MILETWIKIRLWVVILAFIYYQNWTFGQLKKWKKYCFKRHINDAYNFLGNPMGTPTIIRAAWHVIQPNVVFKIMKQKKAHKNFNFPFPHIFLVFRKKSMNIKSLINSSVSDNNNNNNNKNNNNNNWSNKIKKLNKCKDVPIRRVFFR